MRRDAGDFRASVRVTKTIAAALLCGALLGSLWNGAADASDAQAEDRAAAAAPHDKTVVTPAVLLEQLTKRVPELAALPEVAWADKGRRLLVSIADGAAQSTADVTPEDDFIPDAYSLASIDVDSGHVTVIGPGYRPVSASHGDTVAYYVSGSNGREVALARSNGERLCSIRDRDLVSDARSIQAFVLSSDGKRLALAIGFTTTPAKQPAAEHPVAKSDGPAVRVFDTRTKETELRGGVSLWITDVRCHGPRRIVDVPRFQIGRLAWADRDRKVAAVAQTSIVGQLHPRTDLLLFDAQSSAWRTLVRNIGGQAQNTKTGFLEVSPSGEHIAFTYEQEALPYLVRRQFAVASMIDGRILRVSSDPREAVSWLDARTLWVTRSGAHPLMSRAMTVSVDGIEREIGDVHGHGIPSPDGSRLAWLENDLYGNSSLRVASLRRGDSGWKVGSSRVVWHAESSLARYARGERRLMECQSSDGVRPAAIVMLPLGHTSGERHPLIVDIHGGPRGGLENATLAYPAANVLNLSTLEHDLWAAKGYAVLVPDYRASGMYGFAKTPRDGSAFERDFDDIMCNVQAVIDQGIVDPERMAVVGHSHGGMEVNWIITHTDRFKAAISKEGGFNIDLAVAWASRGQTNHYLTALYEAPYDQPERYRRMSVMDLVRGVTTPTLFVEHHAGARPGNLYPWMFAAWQAQGVPAQLRHYDEDTHSLRRPADWKDLLDASIAWIEEHLGNKSPGTPVSADAAGSLRLR